jgi:predicted neuraminidase
MLKLSITTAAILAFALLIYTHKKIGFEFDLTPSSSQTIQINSSSPVFQEITLSTPSPYNHASSIALLGDSPNKLGITWVGGPHELSKKNVIYWTTLALDQKFKPAPISALFDKYKVEQDEHRYIGGIGNPIVVNYANKLWIFFVSTAGGWATSSINYVSSSDQGHSWSKAKMLYTSPFLNFSTGLKGRPILFQDGSLGLPVYTEFLNYGASLLRLSSDGHILDLRRISWTGHTLQPIILPLEPKLGLALMRQSGAKERKIFVSWTKDGGKTWGSSFPLSLGNPNSAITALSVSKSLIFLAANPEDRTSLEFKLLDQNLKEVCTIPFKKQPGKNFSYPYIVQHQDNYFLSYTQNNQISVLKFNDVWLKKCLV